MSKTVKAAQLVTHIFFGKHARNQRGDNAGNSADAINEAVKSSGEIRGEILRILQIRYRRCAVHA